MPKQVDKIKKAKYIQSRLKGNSIRQGLRDAGYTEATASHSSALGVVKCSEQELMNEIRASDITVDWVVKELTKELVAPDAKASDRIRVKELLGKYLNMFKDAQNTQVTIFNDPTIERDAREVIEAMPENPLLQPPQT